MKHFFVFLLHDILLFSSCFSWVDIIFRIDYVYNNLIPQKFTHTKTRYHVQFEPAFVQAWFPIFEEIYTLR